jgi:site-specific DNA recombinase
LENSLYKVYDKIDDIESLIIDARAKKKSLIADKMSTDNIYKSIIYMDKFFEKMSPEERREFIEQLISEVNVYEDRTLEGQWLKSIKFRLPLLEKDMEISLDNGTHIETVVLLTKVERPKAED